MSYDVSLYKGEIPCEQYGVLHAEVRTGIITLADGARILNAPPQYLLFASLNEAEGYAQQRIQLRPEIECILVDNNLKHIKVLQNQEYLLQLRDQTRLNKKKKWWKLW